MRSLQGGSLTVIDALRRHWLMSAPMLVLVLSVLCAWFALRSWAQVITAFTPRYSTNTTGDIVLFGNSMLTCSGTGCGTAQGGTGTPAPINNNFVMTYVNSDSDPTTFNSSRATVSLPAGATVLFAGLYWGADTSAGTGGAAAPTAANRTQVLLDTPAAGGYLPAIVGTQIGISGTRYQAFANITSIVQAAGVGDYTVANLQAGTGADRYAGWGLTIVYSHPSQPLRNLVVYDGYGNVSSGNPTLNINVNGFITPPNGPVATRIGVIAYEGDLTSTGDSMRLNGTTLSNGVNPANDFFNSTISDLGALNTARSPNFTNTFGFDIDRVDASGILPNNATSATIGLTTGGETFFPGVVTFATDLYAPSIPLMKSAVDVNGGGLMPGDVIKYTLVATNTGLDPASNVILRDTIPTNSTYLPGSLIISAGANAGAKSDSLANDQAEFDSANNRVVFRLGTGANGTMGGLMAINDTTTIMFSVTVNAGANGLSVTNQATVDFNAVTSGQSFTGNLSNPVVLQVPTPNADLAVTKTDSVTSVAPGSTTTYTIVVTNNGPDTATNAMVSDAIPAGLTGATWACVGSSGGSCGTANGTGDINTTVTLPNGATATFTLTATVASGTTGTITNAVSVTPPSGTGDSNPNNNNASDTDNITPTADLSITKTDNLTSATPGTATTYTIVVTNSGPSAVTGATVTDTFPATLQSPTWTCTASSGSGCGAASGNGNLATTANLLSGGTATYIVSATIAATATGTITNTANVAAPSGMIDPTPGNNMATDMTALAPSADLTITKTDTLMTATPGTMTTYTIVVTNSGSSAVTGATVIDNFPAVLLSPIWTCVATSGSSCGATNGSGNLNTTANLLVGGSATYTVTATIAANATGTITNTASVAVPSGVTDPTPGNNSATDLTTLAPRADLAITKTDNLTTATPGTATTYTIVVTNNGPSTVSGATVTDTFPSTLLSPMWACAASSGSSCGAANGSGNLNTTANLMVEGIATYTVTATIAANATGTITNTATVTTPGGVTDSVPGNNTATDNTTLAPMADLAITKTDNRTTATPGGATSYTIVVTNNGPSAVTGATVTDAFPASLLSAAWTCAASSGSSCADANGTSDLNMTVNLLVGGSATFTVTATIDPAATGTITNVATVAPPAGVTDSVTNNNSATDVTTLQPSADLSINKVGPMTLVPGTNVTFTITVTNAGPSAATNITVNDPTPPGLTFVSNTGACTSAYPCNIASMAANQTLTIQTTFFVPANYASSTVTNTATVSSPLPDPNPGNNSSTDTIPPSTIADISITKVGPATINAGGNITFTITVTNAGPSDAQNVVVGDATPAGTTFVSNSGACTTAFPCNLASLPAGQMRIIMSTFAIPPGYNAANPLTNSATVSSNTPDPNSENNTSTGIVPVVLQADLGVVKTAAPSPAVVGQPLTYTIVVSNDGPAPDTGVNLNDVLPSNVTFQSITSVAGWTCSTPAVGATGTVSCNLGSGSLAAGAIAMFVVQVIPTAAAGVAGSVTNTATVTGIQPDSNTGNNSSTAIVPVIPSADLVVEKTGPPAVTAGGNLVYTITVTNNGPSSAENVQVSDATPAGNTFVSNTGACTTAFPCNLGTLTAGQMMTITATYAVPPGYSANSVSNTATVSSTTSDPNSGNNSSTAVTPVNTSADVAIDKAGPATFTSGSSVTFTQTITNNGLSDAQNVTVADPPVSGLTFVSNTGACSTAFPCSLGTLAAGQSVVITTTFNVPANFTAASLTNAASVNSTTTDPVPGNNNDSVTLANAPAADLSLNKVGESQLVLGTNTTFTFTVANNGPSDAQNVTVNDPAPAGLTFVSATAPCTGGVTPCSIGTVAAGATVTFTATYFVPSSYVGVIPVENLATVGSTTSDPNPANNNGSATVPATTLADLSIDKSAPATATPGTNVTFSITVVNNGPSNADNVVVADMTPPGLVFVSNAGACTSSFPCSLGTIPFGETRTIIATFAVPATYTTPNPIANTATVSSNTSDANNTNNSDSTTTALTPMADLSITKTNNTTTLVPGMPTTYTIVVTNEGPSAVTNAPVNDTLPAKLLSPTWTCVASGGSSCAAASGAGNIATTVSLLPGETATFTVTATVSATATGTLTNTVTVTAPAGVTETDPNNNSATDTDTLTPEANLGLIKTNSTMTLVPGMPTTYTIVVTNAGPSAVTNATVNDVLPAGLLNAMWTCAASSGSSCGAASGVGNIATTVSLLPNGTATFTLTATVAAGATGTLSNSATVAPPPGVIDPNPNDNTGTDTDTLTPRADLAITKTDNLTNATPGTATSYTIVVTNNGPSIVTGASVMDAFPAALLSPTWTCAASSGSSCGTAGGSGSINALVNLAVGGTVTFTVNGTISSTATGTLANTATVDPPDNVIDPNPANNTATDTTQLVPSADLSVVKVGPVNATPGTSVTYQITVTNNGPSLATNVIVSDPTPSGLTFLSNSGACTTAYPCSIPALASGQTITITTTFAVPANYVASAISNSVSVSSSATDPNPDNNTGTAITPVTPLADLSINKSGTATPVAGQNVTYTIVVTNNGPSDAQNVVVNDPTPAGLTFVSNSGACTSAYPCSFPTLAAGQTLTIMTTFAVPPDFVNPQVTNTATVSSTTPDPNNSNNSSTVSTSSATSADLQITKVGATSATPGTTTTFTITVRNNGPSDAQNVVVGDMTPPGLQFVSNAGACTTAFPCNLNTVPAGQTRTITVTYLVPADYTAPNPIANVATVSSNTPDPNPGNNSGTGTTPLVFSADLAIQKTGPAAITPGTSVIYTITVVNNGPSQATNVVVNDPTPAGLTFVSNTGDCSSAYPCSYATLAVGQTLTITTTYAVPANFSGTSITNTANVTSSTPDPNNNNNSGTTTGAVAPSSDLSINKVGAATLTLGTNTTFMIVVVNNGPSDAQNVTVNDPTPAGLTYVSSTAPCTGGVTPCNLGMVTAGQTVTFTVTYFVPASYAGIVPIPNQASVSSTTPDPNTANNSSLATVTATTLADLTLSKSAPAEIVPGTNVSFIIVVVNRGPSNADNVVVADPTPAGLTFVRTAGDCTSAFPCNLGAVPLGDTRTIIATYAVPPTYRTPDPLLNVALVSSNTPDPNNGNNSDDSSSVITLRADLTMQKNNNATAVTPGLTTTYTLVVTNRGSSAVTGATVTDLLPAAITSAMWTCTATAGSSCGQTSGMGNINTPVNLLPGDTATFTITATIANDAMGTLTNTATVTPPTGVVDPVTDNNTDHDSDPLVPRTDLAVTKYVTPATVLPGDRVTYTIIARNLGVSVANGARITDTLPASLGNATWTCVASMGSSCSAAAGSGNLATTATLLVGGTVTYTIMATVNLSAASGAIINTASVAPPDGAVDSNPTNNSATATNQIGPIPNVGPGTPQAPSSPASDQKPGSILFFPIYTSNAASPHQQNTRINITNADQLKSAIVHLFFVDGSTCTVADSYLCLTPNQTVSYLASDIDPNVTGYMMAVVVNSDGCPIISNTLLGDEYVKFASGHQANLGATAVSGLAGLENNPPCNANSSNAVLRFDGVSYNQLPRVVALNGFVSRADGNDTLVILNRVGGDFSTSAERLGALFGLLYDDAEKSYSFSLTGGCQLRESLSNTFPRTVPRFETAIPAGRTGWLKLWTGAESALFGSAINTNRNAANQTGAFNQGHNLHILRLAESASITIPIVTPGCR